MSLILIVEDNPRNMKLVRDVLQVKGHTTLEAVNAEDGIVLATERIPDLILMDIGLGEMDGCEATRRIKADPETSIIPIIALTASAFESDREKALRAGCCDFDTKPVDLARLLGKMDNWLRAA